jgi:hypothetical protein
MRMNKRLGSRFLFPVLLLLPLALLLYACGRAVYEIAWGTGTWWGEFSLRWGVFFLVFALSEGVLFALSAWAVWRPQDFRPLAQALVRGREKLGAARWLLILLLLLLPIWFFQYTEWGLVFHHRYLRFLVWGIQLGLLTYLLSRNSALVSFPAWAEATLLSGFFFAVAASLRLVTDFPFTLGWSEGNRLWDYSMLFGTERYTLAPGQAGWVHLSLGRQMVGGLPFLYRGLTIAQARAWIGLTYALPYVLLGWVTFWRTRSSSRGRLFLAGLWGALFLLQGPIHPPLIFAATTTVLAWGSPLWLGIPLLIFSGYFAEISRYTWAFAPAMWIGMLEWVSDPWEGGRLLTRGWKRVLTLVSAGLFGGLVLSNLAARWTGKGEGFAVKFTDQPLLWYRLFPNGTYGPGILLALLIATGPLMALLIYRHLRGAWPLRFWQKIAILAPLLAFLVVGLIASTKIGGGGDLHNLDMFLIGLLFTAALAWRSGEFLFSPSPGLLSVFLLGLTLALPSWSALPRLAPLDVDERRIPTLLRLTDIEVDYSVEPERARRALDLLPPREQVERGLQVLREAITEAQGKGEILFMDQRQLLTFGYVQAPLVVEYEKKYVMDQAMTPNVEYFRKFYADLAAHRFALIVTEPLHTVVKDSSSPFGEENNAWVTWVSNPLLCYYKPSVTILDLGLQLLVPNPKEVDCRQALPQEVRDAP